MASETLEVVCGCGRRRLISSTRRRSSNGICHRGGATLHAPVRFDVAVDHMRVSRCSICVPFCRQLCSAGLHCWPYRVNAPTRLTLTVTVKWHICTLMGGRGLFLGSVHCTSLFLYARQLFQPSDLQTSIAMPHVVPRQLGQYVCATY